MLLLFSVVLCSLLFSLFLSSFDSIKIWISLLLLRGKSCRCLCVEMRASFLNRLTYTLCFFRALGRFCSHALPVLLLPMYYRCILARRLFFHPPSRVCVYYHRRARWKEWRRAFENYIQTDDRSSRQRTLSNRYGRPFPLQRKRVFSFFRFSGPFVRSGIRDRRVARQRTGKEDKKQKTTFFSFSRNLSFWRGKHSQRGMHSSLLFNVKFVARKDHERSPFAQTTKKLLFVTVFFLRVFLHFYKKESSFRALSFPLSLLSHIHTQYWLRDWYSRSWRPRRVVVLWNERPLYASRRRRLNQTERKTTRTR